MLGTAVRCYCDLPHHFPLYKFSVALTDHRRGVRVERQRSEAHRALCLCTSGRTDHAQMSEGGAGVLEQLGASNPKVPQEQEETTSMPLFSFSSIQTSELLSFLPTNTQPLFRTGHAQLRGALRISPGRGGSEGSPSPGGTGLSGTCTFPAVVHRTFVETVGIKPLNLHCVQIPWDRARHAVPSGHRTLGLLHSPMQTAPSIYPFKMSLPPQMHPIPKKGHCHHPTAQKQSWGPSRHSPATRAGSGTFPGQCSPRRPHPLTLLPLHLQLSGHTCPPSCQDWSCYTQSPMAGMCPASRFLPAHPQGFPESRTQPMSGNQGASDQTSLCAERTLLLLS